MCAHACTGGRAPAAPSSPQPLHIRACSNGKAAKALTEIGSPAIHWVSLAQVQLEGCVASASGCLEGSRAARRAGRTSSAA